MARGTKPAVVNDSSGNPAGNVVLSLPSSGLSNIPLNMSYSVPIIGTTTTAVTLNNNSDNTGWIDVTMFNPDTLTLLIDASVSTGTIKVGVDFAADAQGITSVGADIENTGITGNTAFLLSSITGWVYAPFIKITITETATAAFTFKSIMFGREV